ncbi:hypothetical protein GCM10022263_41410 [Nocardioides daeguensis]|uniref:Uncharacterized protein n=1 Tax=Nocardioides daeguensis TaxID=908359 RepID=A0ABP6WD16_9ACTN
MEGEDVLDQAGRLRGAQAGAVLDVPQEPRIDVHPASVHPSQSYLKFLPGIGQEPAHSAVPAVAKHRWSAGGFRDRPQSPTVERGSGNGAKRDDRVEDVLPW